jgi:hypothetical protein
LCVTYKVSLINITSQIISPIAQINIKSNRLCWAITPPPAAKLSFITREVIKLNLNQKFNFIEQLLKAKGTLTEVRESKDFNRSRGRKQLSVNWIRDSLRSSS